MQFLITADSMVSLLSSNHDISHY